MTEKMYREAIRKATQSLGLYRAEFSRTRCRLAQIYVRIEALQKALEEGEFSTTRITATKAGELEQIDPHITELDRLNDQALAYEKALGLTADGARKLNEAIFSKKDEGSGDSLTRALRLIGG